MFTPPLRMFYIKFVSRFSLTCYGRFSNEITCVQNDLSFAIKRFGYLFRFLRIFCLNNDLFSQYLLYDYSIFHLLNSSLSPLFFTLLSSAIFYGHKL